MGFDLIIKKEGYRYEDLTEEHKKLIDVLRWLQEDFESFEYNFDAYCEIVDDDTIISKIEMEFAKKVIDGVKEWIDYRIADYQISLRESEPDPEDE